MGGGPPELSAPPKFKFTLISSFKDALTRQIFEAVRIERGGVEILNSKSEFNRCRVPRLRIDQESWNSMRKKVVVVEAGQEEDEHAVHEVEDDDLLEMEILGKAEESGRRFDAKRKQEDETAVKDEGRKKKKRKFDTLVNWGEDTNREDDTNGLDSWLESSATPTEQSDVTREWLLEPFRSAAGSHIMKQQG